ncbi:MAG: DNA ligase D [Deltaproteobacteria bacterium]|nr:DNA ligase D [Deltaproteobacteria bacterium]
MADRPLDRYRRKRDPASTPEPFEGSPTAAGAGSEHSFVIQQHAARRLHWDVRLEIAGVLVSWAVPRGPSVDPKQKRLAVQTEDHPLAYADFEGIIPAGNYGAGAVIVWDRGTYHCVDGVDPEQALSRGKFDLELHGYKLRGRWALVRMKGSGQQWLLFKKAEAAPPPRAEPVASQPQSIFSGLTVQELQAGGSREGELAEQARVAGAVRRQLDPSALAPMLAESAERAFSGTGWLFELKYDGIRALAARTGDGRVRLFSRTRRDITASFPEIAGAVRHLPCADFILDGEIVALDRRGASSFECLQQRLGKAAAAAVARAQLETPVLMYVFDLPAVAGYDLRRLPLVRRKLLLHRLLPPAGTLRFAEHLESEGEAFFQAVREHGLEGVIAKRADSPYSSGRRSRAWLKLKVLRSADLAIVGWLPGQGARQQLGALMLAWRGEAGLRYAGNVGTGFDTRTLATLRAQLERIRCAAAAFDGSPRALARSARLVEPRLVAEIRYAAVTESGMLRQPVFLRLRPDKHAGDCDQMPQRTTAPPPPVAVAPAPALHLSNLDKVFWPQDGYTKGDLLRYYERIWPLISPYLYDRPIVLTRYPDGIAGKSFFQKNAPEFVPDWVRTCRIEDTDYFICNDLDTLRYVINLGCIPLHVWSARSSALDRPDWAVVDLDPKGAPFAAVVRVAKHLHQVLEPLQVPHFVKTSGQDGLHLLLPLAGSLTHDEAKTLAEVLARLIAAELPDLATVARPLSERGGKVYIDFLQNGFGKTIAAPFSARPRPGAPVSTPLGWRELSTRLPPARFTIKTVPTRFRQRADPLRAVLATQADVHAVLAALKDRIGRTG